uniref:Cationic amino acid transporter C-terminal domain-containing protein n=1 Tax=Cucumis melo TaxID=3656 RepID=A0A9I9CUX6_CUCME
MLVRSQSSGDSDVGYGRRLSGVFESLVRRKQVDSENVTRENHHQLAKKLSAIDLVAIGVGATIGAGVYILVGTVAREHAGPSLAISFLIAGVAAALSAFCYAELACRCPSAGSAYHYTYICVGEGVAWLVGWALILEWTIGGSTVARGITPNLALFLGGQDKLPAFLARITIPGLNIVVDPCAAILICIVTALLCIGIKKSSLAQTIVTTINVCALLFIAIVGGYLGFRDGWVGYELPNGYFPFGVNGMFAGSAVVFFSYIGFDSITSTAEEMKNPQRDLPLGIGLTMLICSILYVITIGAVTALFASLLGSILPQPRILMAMARDGLLPSIFADINKHTQVPVKGTIITGLFAAALAFFMDVSQLAGMVSVGTLLAFTTVAISVLILRYVPPHESPLPSSLQEAINSTLSQLDGESQKTDSNFLGDSSGFHENNIQDSNDEGNDMLSYPLIERQVPREGKRRKTAAWAIALVCLGILIVTFTASAKYLPSIPRFVSCGVGGVLLLGSLIVLASLDQDDARHSFGHRGGFSCPFVPFLPVACILINSYLLIDLGLATWIRVSVWFALGALVYTFYGRTHSSLVNAVYVRTNYIDEIYRSSDHVA